MSAAYALPGDVIHVKIPILIHAEDRAEDELMPGHYVFAGLLGGGRLALTTTRAGEDGRLIACHPVHAVPASLLNSETVGISYLKLGGWEDEIDKWFPYEVL